MGIKIRTKVSEVCTPERRRCNTREPYQKRENFLMKVVREPIARGPAAMGLFMKGAPQ